MKIHMPVWSFLVQMCVTAVLSFALAILAYHEGFVTGHQRVITRTVTVTVTRQTAQEQAYQDGLQDCARAAQEAGGDPAGLAQCILAVKKENP